jgi:predicted PhzF superfamily epimerase YddE/YHI9
VTGFIPDFDNIRRLNARGLIISAAGSLETDFISRCFFPRYGINEDAVTGSAHTLLAPYWAKKLGKNKLKALQASKRTGIIECKCEGNRVLLGGSAKTYLKGKINITHGL